MRLVWLLSEEEMAKATRLVWENARSCWWIDDFGTSQQY